MQFRQRTPRVCLEARSRSASTASRTTVGVWPSPSVAATPARETSAACCRVAVAKGGRQRYYRGAELVTGGGV